MKTRGTLVYCGAVVALLAVGLAARADSVQVTATYINDSPTETVTMNSAYLGTYNGGTFYAGASNFTVANVNTDITTGGTYATDLNVTQVQGALGTSFKGFCIDLGARDHRRNSSHLGRGLFDQRHESGERSWN